DPSSALDHYNYLRGRWRDGAQMVWGGNGHPPQGANILADLLFPGDSDPSHWSTLGVTPTPVPWSEASVGNTAFDRRFLQSAGPFTLEPGAVNDLTVGVVWARATTGDNLASIQNLKVADDKAQSLFDNCFKIAEGPDAPAITFQEMDRELILFLSNSVISNNYNEGYNLKDPFIAIPDTLDGVYQGPDQDKDTLKFYKFQGYQIYQVVNASISVEQLYNNSVARLAAQVDIKDGITQLVNFTFDESINANIPQEMVNGEDKGIKHSFRFTTDLFASGDNRLVNHKTYYYIAIAYGYNSFKDYDPNDPFKLDGQKKPYISSRKSGSGGGITSFAAIPHNPAPEAGGTYANAVYGDQPQITRVEGQGNGGNNLDLTSETEARIVANGFDDFLVYKKGRGPINVKVVDPLNVRAGAYRVQFSDTATLGNLIDAFWTLHTPLGEAIASDQAITKENEQLILNHGISISIVQAKNAGDEAELGSGLLTGSLEYADPSKAWLSGFRDREGQTDANWIRSGSSLFASSGSDPYDDFGLGSAVYDVQNPTGFVDPNQDFEGILGGIWAPYRMVSFIPFPISPTEVMQDAVGLGLLNGTAVKRSKLRDVPSVDIVFTSDKSKWSRAMVLEAQSNKTLSQGPNGGAEHLQLRDAQSVDKNGNP
ncbi:MAG: T9SS C-terminal target domain-containing protein, partial [Bacteroidetes bacterium]|nr:T9SS C-terminal target domain-containing protein [Bacteroidota bacterium]